MEEGEESRVSANERSPSAAIRAAMLADGARARNLYRDRAITPLVLHDTMTFQSIRLFFCSIDKLIRFFWAMPSKI